MQFYTLSCYLNKRVLWKNIFECLPNSTWKCIVRDVNYSIITKKSIILIVRNYGHVSFYQARYTRADFMFKNGNILFHMIEFMIHKNSIITKQSKWPNLQICQIMAWLHDINCSTWSESWIFHTSHNFLCCITIC